MATRVSSRHARPADAATLLTVLVEAFLADPFWAHILPDPEQPGFARASALSDCMRTEIASYIGHGHTYLIDDRAAALWTPPGIRADEDPLIEKLTEHGDEQRLEAAIAPFMELGAWRPDDPHFYLHLIGASDRGRGKGLGSALLERVLEVCDAEDTPAYLEASSARSAHLYERHGFAELATVDFAPGVVLRPMLRVPV